MHVKIILVWYPMSEALKSRKYTMSKVVLSSPIYLLHCSIFYEERLKARRRYLLMDVSITRSLLSIDTWLGSNLTSLA